MSTRRAKQLIYGALYLLIILLLITVFYFIFVRSFIGTPTVVDCATNICIPTSTAEITTSTVSIFVTSSGHYTFLAQVINGDTDFGAQSLNYQINLYDINGTLIESVPAQSFIYPNQSKYVVIPNITVSESVDHATLVVTGASWIASSTLGAIPQFVLQNAQVSTGSNSISVSGQLINSNIGSFEKVMVLALFKDKNNNIIGVSQTEVDNIQPQSINNYSVIYPPEPGIDLANNQIIVYAIR